MLINLLWEDIMTIESKSKRIKDAAGSTARLRPEHAAASFMAFDFDSIVIISSYNRFINIFTTFQKSKSGIDPVKESNYFTTSFTNIFSR